MRRAFAPPCRAVGSSTAGGTSVCAPLKGESLVPDQSPKADPRDANAVIGNESDHSKASLGERKPLQVANSKNQANQLGSKHADSRSNYYTVLYTKKAQKVRGMIEGQRLSGEKASVLKRTVLCRSARTKASWMASWRLTRTGSVPCTTWYAPL